MKWNYIYSWASLFNTFQSLKKGKSLVIRHGIEKKSMHTAPPPICEFYIATKLKSNPPNLTLQQTAHCMIQQLHTNYSKYDVIVI